jgi:hypothetical protein
MVQAQGEYSKVVAPSQLNGTKNENADQRRHLATAGSELHIELVNLFLCGIELIKGVRSVDIRYGRQTLSHLV